MSAWEYSVHAYAWTNHWCNESLDLIDHAKGLGCDRIEIPLMEIDDIDPAAICRRLDTVGLGVITSTVLAMEDDLTGEKATERQRGVDYLKRCVDATAQIGATILGGVLYSAIGRKLDGMPGKEYFRRAAEGLKEVAQYAQSQEITLALEPINRYETFLVNTCQQGLDLLKQIDEPNVGLHLDSYHMNIEEEDFYNPTKQAGNRLLYYHVSESHRGTPGTGTINWDDIVRALVEIGYQGVLGLESYTEVSDAMRPATCIWRPLAPSSDELISGGLEFFKELESRHKTNKS